MLHVTPEKENLGACGAKGHSNQPPECFFYVGLCAPSTVNTRLNYTLDIGNLIVKAEKIILKQL
jgi:hypothetical protein